VRVVVFFNYRDIITYSKAVIIRINHVPSIISILFIFHPLLNVKIVCITHGAINLSFDSEGSIVILTGLLAGFDEPNSSVTLARVVISVS